MSVNLRVEECTSFREFPLVFEYEGNTRQAAIAGYLTEHRSDARFTPEALISLLSIHDEFRMGGPTWDVKFTQTFV